MDKEIAIIPTVPNSAKEGLIISTTFFAKICDLFSRHDSEFPKGICESEKLESVKSDGASRNNCLLFELRKCRRVKI